MRCDKIGIKAFGLTPIYSIMNVDLYLNYTILGMKRMTRNQSYISII